MTPLAVAYVSTAAICAVVGIQHLVLGSRVGPSEIYLLFGGAALAAGVDALIGTVM